MFRCAVWSGTGTARDANEDAAYGGARLLAVADGTGGGEASAAAIDALRQLDTQVRPEHLLDVLERALNGARSSIRSVADRDPALQGIGTTLTAIVVSGSKLGLLHVGDTRAYLLRDGEFVQLTRDHTLLQMMLERGKITSDNIACHSRARHSMLMRLLTADGGHDDADLEVRDVRAGDRYLLCSDGLHEFASDDAIARVLRSGDRPDAAVRDLAAVASVGGGSDDVTCVVADAVPPAASTPAQPAETRL